MRDVLELQEAIDRVEVDVARHVRVLEDRLRLRGKPEAAVADGIEERLLADAIADEEQSPPPAIPDREREHASQALHAGVPVVLVEVDDHLGVGLRGEAVPPGLELAAQLAVVIDLAVLDDD